MEEIIYSTPVQKLDFFNFQFEVMDGQLLKTTMNWQGGEQVLDPCIWASLFLVKQKYDEKNERLKKRTKEFDKKQKNYCENLEKWRKDKEHLQDHIKRAETKLCEYKNTILAFGKLATCNSISK